MRSVNVIQCSDPLQPDRGWFPVMVTNSREEADLWIEDEKKYDTSKGRTDVIYRIGSARHCSR